LLRGGAGDGDFGGRRKYMTSQATHYYGFGLTERPIFSGRRLANNLQYMQRFTDQAEKAFAEPFKGITTDGNLVPNLFPIRKTGVPTRPITEAARTFLASLSDAEREQTCFPIDSEEWRHWFNISPYVFRHGMLLEEMSQAQCELALAMVREAMSEAGFESIRNVMRLNHTIGEITGKAEEYGEWVYFLSIFGEPSEEGPWGWQIDGHHLNLHCFILDDQMVFTPAFLGSEPVVAMTGKFAGVSVLQEEERSGLVLMQSLDQEQQARAIIASEVHGAMTGAFRDNFELRYEGIAYDDLSAEQRERLLEVVRLYVGRMRPGHDAVKLDEVRQHLSQTYFAWIGESGDDSVFYYRVHSPVIIIEFDHQAGTAFNNRTASRNHIHTIVRTPNGNDYGKDLLRQHHEQFRH
jgi:hypothetical protein